MGQQFAHFVGLTIMHKYIEIKTQAPGLGGKDRTAIICSGLRAHRELYLLLLCFLMSESNSETVVGREPHEVIFLRCRYERQEKQGV